jgi:hypothetical protein
MGSSRLTTMSIALHRLVLAIRTAFAVAPMGGSSDSFWRALGWRQNGDSYVGHYDVLGTPIPGRVTYRSAWDSEFAVLAPRELIDASGDHRICFRPQSKKAERRGGWFEVHFSRRPESAASGVAAIQRILCLAAIQLRKNNRP